MKLRSGDEPRTTADGQDRKCWTPADGDPNDLSIGDGRLAAGLVPAVEAPEEQPEDGRLELVQGLLEHGRVEPQLDAHALAPVAGATTRRTSF